MIRGTLRSRTLHRSLRHFSSTARCCEIRDIAQLPPRIHPRYLETKQNDLLCLQWPAPPRNVLITKKNRAPHINESVLEFAKHIHSTYPNIALILEPKAADELHKLLPFPVYSTAEKSTDMALPALHDKVDVICSLGGDGTILHASSLFATTRTVPPVLSFSMGTLGFLGEWKFGEYKRAFREVYMSGASAGYGSALLEGEEPFHPDAARMHEESGGPETTPHEKVTTPAGWSSIRGKSMGLHRGSRVLLRNRLKVGVFDPDGKRVSGDGSDASAQSDIYAMNEVTMHRGAAPHLAIIEVSIGGRFLTEAVADGMIVSTPTGSTAYSLSSGGCIVHPLVASLLLTPICPRSLSFRPLVLPANTPISLRLSEKNRGAEVEVSIDGMRRPKGLGLGMEVRVWGEGIRDGEGVWAGGVPSIVRGANGGGDISGEDHWVGGLNGLLKFNYPFGEL